MKIRFYSIFIIFFSFILNNLYSYEIIRDPIFEDYFVNINEELELNKTEVYLVRDESPNAFVIKDSIYFTTGLLKILNEEDTLKAIYLHEYGHLIKNHFQSKKIKIQQSNDKNSFYSLFSIGLAVISGSANIGIGTSITLNSNLVNEISRHSVNFEIEADNFMIEKIIKNKINTSELTSFLSEISDTSNNYFRTHPKNEDRINNLKDFNFKKNENSSKFEWIKSKYSRNSKNESFNFFFNNLEKGIFIQKEISNKINNHLFKYEAFKKGLFIKDWNSEFYNLFKINDNTYLKIEYINYLLDNNLVDKYYLIEDLKFNKNIMNEYFYYYIYGKYYNKIKDIHLSNFYFCQFYKAINSKNKADFFCKKYDIKDIPTLDKFYALFK